MNNVENITIKNEVEIVKNEVANKAKKIIKQTVSLNKDSKSFASKSIIDEIINIKIDLANFVVIPNVGRKFAVFSKAVSENKLIIRKSNLEDSLLQITSDTLKNNINMWFSSGGTEITVYQALNDMSSVIIDEVNLIFVNDTTEEQIEIFNLLSTQQTLNKNLYFSVNEIFNLGNIQKDRDIKIWLSNSNADKLDNLPFFEYYAPYTQKGFYRRTYFENSVLDGLKLKTLDYLNSNKIGSLVYIEELQGSHFYNVVGSTGVSVNWDFLKLDLENDIQTSFMEVILENGDYDQAKISTLESQIDKIGELYKQNKLILEYDSFSIAFKDQSKEDINNNHIEGFKISYKPTRELKSASVVLQEVL